MDREISAAFQVAEEMGFDCLKEATLDHLGVSRNMSC